MANDMLKKCCDDINKYSSADEALVASMLKTYRLVISKSDSRLVACSDAAELATIRKNFLQKKLGMTKSDTELDELIAGVCAKMKGARQKNRLTFYYLLVEATASQGVFS